MGYKGNKYRHKKKKTLKKTKTRDIALRALKKVNEQESEEETKWFDFNRANSRMRSYSGYASSTSINCTAIRPIGQGATPSALETFNRRIGAKIHISGVYLNIQYSWPTITDSSIQRYPPFACIKYVLVLQKKSQLGVAGGDVNISPNAPIPQDVYQRAQAVDIATPEEQPLSIMLFKNMNNGHNYRVLAEGELVLPGPVVNNNDVGSMYMEPAATQPYTLGECPHSLAPAASPDTQISQYSQNAVRNIKIRVNPNVKARYVNIDQPEDAASNSAIRPVENGIYFMTWTDQAGAADARWQPPGSTVGPPPTPAATYTYQEPVYWVNLRTRFTDA